MSNYDLNQLADDKESFPFSLNGNTYTFTYPTTEEVDEIFASKLDNGNPDMEAIMKRLFSFIRADNDGAPNIEEALRKSKIPVNKAFQDMVLKEFGFKE